MAFSYGFSREAMRESGQNHGNSVIRREREIGLSNVRFELINDGGEDGIRESVG